MLVAMAATLLARHREMRGPAWAVVMGANVGALRVLYEALQQEPVGITAGTGLAVLLFFFVGHLLITVTNTLVRRRPLTAFEGVQTAIALVLGHGGAMLVSRVRDTATAPLGIGTLAVAALVYGVAFALLDRARRRTFVYLTTLAFVLVVGGCAVLLAHPELPWIVLALVTVLLGRRFGRVTLSHQGAFYAVAAAFTSGLVASAGTGWMGAADGAWTRPTSFAWGAVAALVGAALFPPRTSARYHAALSFVPQLIVIAVLAWSGGGLILHAVQPLLPGDDPAVLATARMVVFVGLSLGLLAAARLRRLAACRYLLGPMLLAGAAKLALEDLVVGRPLTLAFSFALYGALLMAGPRIARAASGLAQDGGGSDA